MTPGQGRAAERLRIDELLYAAVGGRDTPMQIALLCVFDGTRFRRPDGTPDAARVRAELAARCWRVPELRRRVLWTRLGEGRPLWIDDPGFDPFRCILPATLPTVADLPEWAANRAARGLPRDGTPWRAEVVDGLPGGDVAVLLVVSHVLADGLAGVALIGALLDRAPDAAPPPPPEGPVPAWPTHHELRRRRLREVIGRTGRHRAARPGRTRPGLRQMRTELAGFAGPEPVTPWPRRIGPGRRMLVVRQPLAELERAGHVLGGTVNDLLLAAVAAGLRSCLAARGPVPPGLVLRAMVPVAADRGGRQVSAMLVVGLPVGDPDPLHRLSAVHGATTAAKARLRAAGGEAIDLPVPRVVGRWVVRASRRYGSRRVTVGTTDVPGPRMPLWLAGARLLSAVPIAPMSPGVPLSVAALSYAGELAVSINADATATGLDVLAEGTARGFTELVERARPRALR